MFDVRAFDSDEIKLPTFAASHGSQDYAREMAANLPEEGSLCTANSSS
jgi:hypothetical protein